MNDLHDNEVPTIESDPMYCAGYNDALEWVAKWLTGALGGYSEETVNTLNAMAETLRAAKKPIQQQSFFDAIRNDPFMPPEIKKYWLDMRP